MSMIVFDIVTQLILIISIFVIGVGVGIKIVTDDGRDRLR